jgi:hypothetical protein
VVKATTAITQVTENLIIKTASDLDRKATVRKATDAIALLGHASQELSARRKEAIRPALISTNIGLCVNKTRPQQLPNVLGMASVKPSKTRNMRRK